MLSLILILSSLIVLYSKAMKSKRHFRNIEKERTEKEHWEEKSWDFMKVWSWHDDHLPLVSYILKWINFFGLEKIKIVSMAVLFRKSNSFFHEIHWIRRPWPWLHGISFFFHPCGYCLGFFHNIGQIPLDFIEQE